MRSSDREVRAFSALFFIVIAAEPAAIRARFFRILRGFHLQLCVPRIVDPLL
jgi:hypothetical protein